MHTCEFKILALFEEDIEENYRTVSPNLSLEKFSQNLSFIKKKRSSLRNLFFHYNYILNQKQLLQEKTFKNAIYQLEKRISEQTLM